MIQICEFALFLSPSMIRCKTLPNSRNPFDRLRASPQGRSNPPSASARPCHCEARSSLLLRGDCFVAKNAPRNDIRLSSFILHPSSFVSSPPTPSAGMRDQRSCRQSRFVATPCPTRASPQGRSNQPPSSVRI